VGTPPKISDIPVREAHVEVLPPEPARAQGQPGVQPISAPIHALSALVLVAVDSLWAVFDFVPPIWLVAIPGCFMACFVPVYLIQRHLRNDTPHRALAIATLLAVLAAIPTPISGTPIGVGLLAWTGLGKLFGKQKHW
jgi:hypothetical protein